MKGEMSIPIIITAVLALVVLVILLMFFNDKMGFVRDNTGCATFGGTCVARSQGCEGSTLVADCPGQEICCDRGGS